MITTLVSRSRVYAVAASICGLVVEYIVAIDVTRVRFPADALNIFFADNFYLVYGVVRNCVNHSVWSDRESVEQLWSSGYDDCLTRSRSPAQSWAAVLIQIFGPCIDDA